MKNLKKLTIIVLTIAMFALTFTSCSKPDANSKDTTVGETTVALSDDTTTTVDTTVATTEETTTAPDVTTLAPETEPKKELVFESLKKFEFKDGNVSAFSAGGTSENVRFEDNCLVFTSTGGDPNLMLADPLDMNAADIEYINIKYKNLTPNYDMQLFFTTDVSTELSEALSFKYYLDYSSDDTPNEWNILSIDTSECVDWQDVIKTIRLDLSNGEGDFQVEYISFDKVVG